MKTVDYSKIFTHPMFGEVRTVANGDEIWFCLVDVCSALGLQTYYVKERLEDDLVSTHPISDALGRTQQANFVNEEGLYEVIFQSRKPIAKDFRKWVRSTLTVFLFFAIYIMYTYIINNKGEEERYADNISTQEEDKISAAV